MTRDQDRSDPMMKLHTSAPLFLHHAPFRLLLSPPLNRKAMTMKMEKQKQKQKGKKEMLKKDHSRAHKGHIWAVSFHVLGERERVF